MPVESATFISQLVATNPLVTDPIAQDYEHLQLTKSVLQNQFTNLGTTAVTATADQINTAAALSPSMGVVTVPSRGSTAGGLLALRGVSGSGSAFVANDTTGTGQSALMGFSVNNAGDTVAVGSMVLSSAGLSVAGTLSATTVLQNGLSIIPLGLISLWSGTLASIPAGWLLCNGANGTPDLRDRFVLGAGGASLPGAAGGASSATTSTTTTGAHTHTGSTGLAGGVTPTGVTDTQGAHTHSGTSDGHALTVTELPAHHHEQQIGQGGGGNNAWNITGSGAPTDIGYPTLDTGGNAAHSHTFTTGSAGSHNHNVTINPIADHTHSIGSDGNHNHSVTVATVPPYFALAYIMFVG